ncbi:hypothetical protein GOBAR_AA26440 [Gossypium barbadense]|uniref:Secreted protein n=1 Tax=Gossypium barbadense TaxID=3634 RepID=A0A2P5WT28_GOSBA|nr:hypothetical protein GOBAR_AA26440 [Gossypium barbadense]
MFGVTTLASIELVGFVWLKMQILTPPPDGCSSWNTSSRSSSKAGSSSPSLSLPSSSSSHSSPACGMGGYWFGGGSEMGIPNHWA